MQGYLRLNNEAYKSFMDYLKHILQHAKSFGSRSSILSVLAWIFGTLFFSITLAGVLKAETWLLIAMFLLLVVVLISILVAFFYCLFTGNTDILRSEKFVIEKLAIEKQVASDSVTGTQTITHNNTNHVNSIETVEDDINEA